MTRSDENFSAGEIFRMSNTRVYSLTFTEIALGVLFSLMVLSVLTLVLLSAAGFAIITGIAFVFLLGVFAAICDIAVKFATRFDKSETKLTNIVYLGFINIACGNTRIKYLIDVFDGTERHNFGVFVRRIGSWLLRARTPLLKDAIFDSNGKYILGWSDGTAQMTAIYAPTLHETLELLALDCEDIRAANIARLREEQLHKAV